jgi:hypothetical protein
MQAKLSSALVLLSATLTAGATVPAKAAPVIGAWEAAAVTVSGLTEGARYYYNRRLGGNYGKGWRWCAKNPWRCHPWGS